MKSDVKEAITMLYPFMTLEDGTEIVHSESMQDSGREKVKLGACDHRIGSGRRI